MILFKKSFFLKNNIFFPKKKTLFLKERNNIKNFFQVNLKKEGKYKKTINGEILQCFSNKNPNFFYLKKKELLKSY
jgi:hypothetical protein